MYLYDDLKLIHFRTVFAGMLTMLPLPSTSTEADTIHLPYPAATVTVFLDLVSVSKPSVPYLGWTDSKHLFLMCEQFDCERIKSEVLTRLYELRRMILLNYWYSLRRGRMSIMGGKL